MGCRAYNLGDVWQYTKYYCGTFDKLMHRGGWLCRQKKECSCTFPGNTAKCDGAPQIRGCSASSEYSNNYGCQKAYDGSYGTDWATRGQGVGSWIRLNFTQKTGVSKVKIANRKGNERNRKIELSFDDGSSVVKLLANNFSLTT